MSTRQCVHCKKEFTPKSPHHMFCGVKHRQIYNNGRTWERYFKKLLNNNAKERKQLAVSNLLNDFHKQKGLCALSGVKLTKIAGKGVVNTNASIDRIDPKGGYVPGNIRLVCVFVNSFRGNVTDKELKFWCKKIAGN